MGEEGRQMSPQSILALAAIAAAVGSLVGWMLGRQRGRDEQWCDTYFAAARRDRARRNRLGQFKPHAHHGS